MHRYLYANDNPTTFIDPTGHVARQMLDESINRSANNSSWLGAGVNAFFKEAGYQTLDLISFGALHRQDKLVDKNLAGEISDAEYYSKTGVNVALSAGQAAMTLGTGGTAGATRGAAMAWGAAGGMAGQGISDIGEVYGTETKSLEDVRARDYFLGAAMGAAGGAAGYRARGLSQAEKAGVIAEQGQSVTPDVPAPAAAAASSGNVNVQRAIKSASTTEPRALPPGPQPRALIGPAGDPGLTGRAASTGVTSAHPSPGDMDFIGPLQPHEQPPVLGVVRPYDVARRNRFPGYDEHHLDAPLGRRDPTYSNGLTTPVRNDNAGGKVPGGENWHTGPGGLQAAHRAHIRELGYTQKQWNNLPDTTRLLLLRRYYASLGIPFDK